MLSALLLAAAADYPQIAASDKLCVNVAEVTDATANAKAAGWAEIVPEKDTPLGQLISIYGAFKAPPIATFKSPDAEHPLYLVARETIPAPVGIFVECTIYDFERKEELPLDMLVQWQGRKPDYSFKMDGVAQLWINEGGVDASVLLERPPCLSEKYCPEPRVTVQRSVLKPQ